MAKKKAKAKRVLLTEYYVPVEINVSYSIELKVKSKTLDDAMRKAEGIAKSLAFDPKLQNEGELNRIEASADIPALVLK
jgi:hypothetical protein